MKKLFLLLLFSFLLIISKNGNATLYTDDLCSGGAAISGGDHASYPKAQAFDDNTGTQWGSSQNNGDVSGAAYIGYDFGSGVTKTIEKFTIKQGADPNSIGSVKLEYSDNGSSWTSLQTFTIADDDSFQFIVVTVTSSAHRYWRILANEDTHPTITYLWVVAEVEMMESRGQVILIQ